MSLPVSAADIAGLIDERRAAEILRLSVRTLQAARQDYILKETAGLPDPLRIGRRVFYSVQEVEDCLKARLELPRLKRKFEEMKNEPAA